MSRKRVPSYRLRKAGHKAVVTLCGKDFYLGPYNSRASRDEYDRLIAEWLANGRRLPGQDRIARLTVAELIDEYWKFAKGYYQSDGKPTKELACMRDAVRPLNRHAARQGRRPETVRPRYVGRRIDSPAAEPQDGVPRPPA